MQNTPRFLVESSQINNSRFKITDYNQNKKIRQVLRLVSGDKVILFDGNGTEYLSELELVSNDIVSGIILEKKTIQDQGQFNITLAQAFPKAGKLDEIVKMCTEVGVNGFAFFESDYSIPKLNDYKEKKLERLNKIIQEATRQSERAIMPEIIGLFSYKEIIENASFDVRLLLSTHTETEVKDIKAVKTDLISQGKKSILLIIGSEGGFSKKELEAALSQQVMIAKMNLPILRTETAGVVAAGFLLI